MVPSPSELDAARRAGAEEQRECAAEAVRWEAASGHVVVSLPAEVELRFPPHAVEGLELASAEDLGSLHLVDGGLGLRIDRLDLDISVPALLKGFRGSPAWMAGHRPRRESASLAVREDAPAFDHPPAPKPRWLVGPCGKTLAVR